MSDKAVFEKVEPYIYSVPGYSVVEGKGIVPIPEINAELSDEQMIPCCLRIQMVRGSRIDGENKVEKLDGILVEQLIAVAIDHLEAVNVGHLKNTYSDNAIDCLKEAGLWLLKRETERKQTNVLGTYQK